MTPIRTARPTPGNPTVHGIQLMGDDRGQVTGFVVLITAVLVLLAGLVADGGLGLSAKLEAINTAQEAARAAAQNLDLTSVRTGGRVRIEPADARRAAEEYLAATGATRHQVVIDDDHRNGDHQQRAVQWQQL